MKNQSSKYSSVFCNGLWQQGTSSNKIEVINPCTEKIVGSWQAASIADTNKAITSATTGLQVWSNVDSWQKCTILHKIADIMRKNFKQASTYLAEELGKPLAQGQREWQMSIDQFEWFGDEARRLSGKLVASRTPDCYYNLTYQPVGVVGAFSAWNFPPLLASRKIAPALAAGCAIVLRPSSEAPSAVMLLIDCCQQAGVPEGVVNLVVGNIVDTYEPIMNSTAVRKISLTGSTQVGRQMIKDSTINIKKLSMELGGNAPAIIFDDIDIKKVVDQAIPSKYANAGQVCVSPDRFFVHSKIYSEFVDYYLAKVKEIKVGNTLEDADITMGPIVNQRRLDEITKIITKSVKQGAKILWGGKVINGLGYFFEPTVLEAFDDKIMSNCQENFAPITSFTKFDDEEEVYKRANVSEFGLASYVFSQNKNRINRAVNAIEAGMVAANTFVLASANIPFGGIKQSGYGREGGEVTIYEYCNLKVAHHFTGA